MCNCCKSEEGPQEITELDDYNKNTYGNTYNQNNEDIFKTRPPCWFGHQCSCPCHTGKGKCLFKIKAKKHDDFYPKAR